MDKRTIILDQVDNITFSKGQIDQRTFKLGETRVVTVKPETEQIEVTPSLEEQVFLPSVDKYIDKATVKAITSDLIPNLKNYNIRKGVTIIDIEGNLEPDKPDQVKEVTPTEEQQSVKADSGFELVEAIVKAIPSDYVGSGVQRQQETTVKPTTGEVTAVSANTYVEGDIKVSPILLETATVTPTTIEQDLLPSEGVDGFSGVKIKAVDPSDYYKPETSVTITPTKSQQTTTPTDGQVFNQVITNPIPDEFADVTGVTATASDVIVGKKFVDNTGALLDGTAELKEDLDTELTAQEDAIDELQVVAETLPTYTPTAEIVINANGDYDVSKYGKAKVQVESTGVEINGRKIECIAEEDIDTGEFVKVIIDEKIGSETNFNVYGNVLEFDETTRIFCDASNIYISKVNDEGVFENKTSYATGYSYCRSILKLDNNKIMIAMGSSSGAFVVGIYSIDDTTISKLSTTQLDSNSMFRTSSGLSIIALGNNRFVYSGTYKHNTGVDVYWGYGCLFTFNDEDNTVTPIISSRSGGGWIGNISYLEDATPINEYSYYICGGQYYSGTTYARIYKVTISEDDSSWSVLSIINFDLVGSCYYLFKFNDSYYSFISDTTNNKYVFLNVPDSTITSLINFNTNISLDLTGIVDKDSYSSIISKSIQNNNIYYFIMRNSDASIFRVVKVYYNNGLQVEFATLPLILNYIGYYDKGLTIYDGKFIIFSGKSTYTSVFETPKIINFSSLTLGEQFSKGYTGVTINSSSAGNKCNVMIPN